MGGDADTDLLLLMLMRLWTPPLTAPLRLNINDINHHFHHVLSHDVPGPVLLLAGGGDAGVGGVCLEAVIELGDVGQDGQAVRAAPGHVGHVQQGGDPQADLGSVESQLAVPEKIVESFYQGDIDWASSVQQRQIE